MIAHKPAQPERAEHNYFRAWIERTLKTPYSFHVSLIFQKTCSMTSHRDFPCWTQTPLTHHHQIPSQSCSLTPSPIRIQIYGNPAQKWGTQLQTFRCQDANRTQLSMPEGGLSHVALQASRAPRAVFLPVQDVLKASVQKKTQYVKSRNMLETTQETGL